jgi:putative SOS response-associated peptidase YedK
VAVDDIEEPACNLYSITTNQAAVIALFRVVNRYVGNLAPMPGVFPDYKAPIVRTGAEGRELATARWGMPSSQHALMEATKKRAAKLEAKGKPVDFKELLRMEPDGGTTNIRNVKSKHWARWLGVENRCVVPFNSFSEFNKAEGGDIWFALDESRPLVCFAGIWTNWLYAFLTTEPNAEVGAIHPKAMPVNELCRNRPSDVMSRYATSAKKLGSTHVAFGFLIGFVSLDFGLTTVSSCFLIWLETVRDQPVPTLPM